MPDTWLFVIGYMVTPFGNLVVSFCYHKGLALSDNTPQIMDYCQVKPYLIV